MHVIREIIIHKESMTGKKALGNACIDLIGFVKLAVINSVDEPVRKYLIIEKTLLRVPIDVEYV